MDHGSPGVVPRRRVIQGLPERCAVGLPACALDLGKGISRLRGRLPPARVAVASIHRPFPQVPSVSDESSPNPFVSRASNRQEFDREIRDSRAGRFHRDRASRAFPGRVDRLVCHGRRGGCACGTGSAAGTAFVGGVAGRLRSGIRESQQIGRTGNAFGDAGPDLPSNQRCAEASSPRPMERRLRVCWVVRHGSARRASICALSAGIDSTSPPDCRKALVRNKSPPCCEPCSPIASS